MGEEEQTALQVSMMTFQQVQAIHTYIKTKKEAEEARDEYIKVLTDQYIKDKQFLKQIIIVLAGLLVLFAGIQGARLIFGLL